MPVTPLARILRSVPCLVFLALLFGLVPSVRPRLLAQTPCVDCLVGEITCNGLVSGVLEDTDCELGDGTFREIHSFTLTNDSDVNIILSSPAFDPALFLLDENCALIAANDDCVAGDPDACLVGNLAAGNYFLAVHSVNVGELGAYDLQLDCVDPGAPCSECLVGEISCGTPVSGALATTDCELNDGTFREIYSFNLTEDQFISVDLSSIAFDPALFILDENCGFIAFNDDCEPGDPDRSCLAGNLAAGNYFIAVHSTDPGNVGAFDLSIDCSTVVNPCADCLVSELTCGDSVTGELAATDCTMSDGTFHEFYSFTLTGDSTISIDLASVEFDAFVVLRDEDCNILAANDFCEPGDLERACISATLAAGNYSIEVLSFSPGETGAFSLELQCNNLCDDCLAGDIACGGVAEGELADATCNLADGTFYATYRLEVESEEDVLISLRSDEFDTFLFLLDGSCSLLDTNDDCIPNAFDQSCLAARLTPGTYYIGVNSFAAGQMGAYALEVQCLPTAVDFLRADTNSDLIHSLVDVVIFLRAIYLEGQALACTDSGDFDDNGELNLLDAMGYIQWLFAQGPPPGGLHPFCGLDFTGDSLDCESFPGCDG